MTYFGAIGDFDGDTCVFGLDMTEDAIKKAQEQLDDILNPEKKENRSLKEKVDNLGKTLQKETIENKHLVAEIEKLKAENKNLKSSVANIMKCRDIDPIVERRAQVLANAKFKKMNSDFEDVRKAFGRTCIENDELKNLKKSNDLLLDAYLKLCQEHVNLKKANEGLKKTNARRKKLIGNLYGKNAKLYNEYQLGMECHRKLCKEFDELNENYDKLMKAHSKLCGDYCELDKKYKSLSATKTERLDVRPPATERRGFA